MGSSEKGVLVEPVGREAVHHADEVHERHATRVEEHAADDVHGLRGPEGDVPGRQLVDFGEHLLGDLRALHDDELALQRGHDPRHDDRGEGCREDLGQHCDQKRTAHSLEPCPVGLVVRSLPDGQRLCYNHERRRDALQLPVDEESQETRVHELRQKQLPQLALGNVRDRGESLEPDKKLEEDQEDLIEDADSEHANDHHAVGEGLVLTPILAHELGRAFEGRPDQVRVRHELLRAEAVHGHVVLPRQSRPRSLDFDGGATRGVLHHPQIVRVDTSVTHGKVHVRMHYLHGDTVVGRFPICRAVRGGQRGAVAAVDAEVGNTLGGSALDDFHATHLSLLVELDTQPILGQRLLGAGVGAAGRLPDRCADLGGSTRRAVGNAGL
mmetsp:Transcript_114941/g.287257  ORF Transcript_114941/g.287257 Transcript_114941/m.287257 type:complete len:383 (-) Transcript_114941:1612-2760(-)